jgi:hypothetical protein
MPASIMTAQTSTTRNIIKVREIAADRLIAKMPTWLPAYSTSPSVSCTRTRETI